MSGCRYSRGAVLTRVGRGFLRFASSCGCGMRRLPRDRVGLVALSVTAGSVRVMAGRWVWFDERRDLMSNFEFNDDFKKDAREMLKEPERKLNAVIARVQREHGSEPLESIVQILGAEVRRGVPEIQFPESDIREWASDIQEAEAGR